MRQRARDRGASCSGRGFQEEERRRLGRPFEQGHAFAPPQRGGAGMAGFATSCRGVAPLVDPALFAHRSRLANGAYLGAAAGVRDEVWCRDARRSETRELIPDAGGRQPHRGRNGSPGSQLRQFAGSLPQIVWELDRRGRLIYVNRCWLEYSGQEFSGRLDAALAFVHPEDVAQIREDWRAAFAAQRAFECQVRLRRHDGEYRWFLCRAAPTRNRMGRVVRWLGSATDVHDLRRAQEIMQQADRCKNDFLAALSHELRNPLVPINNCLRVLERAAPGGEEARRAQSIISRQVNQLARLVDDLLDVTRISHNVVELDLTRVDLAELVRRAVEDHLSLFEQNGVTLELSREPAPVFVQGDPSRLLQIIGNLLQNAAKFTPRGGSTRVSVEDSEVGWAVVRIIDTGAGLDAGALAQLFKPFTRGSDRSSGGKGGLGLGLALVKGLVERHRGDVAAHSEGPGKGTEFVVRLPLAAESD